MRNNMLVVLFGLSITLCMAFNSSSNLVASEIDAAEKTEMANEDRVISIEITPYAAARIEQVDLEYKYKEGYLYVKGAVRNLRSRYLVGARVIADFLNEKGKLVAREYGVVYPRTIRYKRMKGRFSVKTKIDNTIATCVLKLAWHGKRQ